MPRRIISESDVSEPFELRKRLQEAYDNIYALLSTVEGLRAGLKHQTGGALTAQERSLLKSLAIGSTENPVAAQRPVVPTVNELPPVQTSTDGEMVRFNDLIYIFDGSTSTWNDITAAASSHNILSATHGDTVAATVAFGDVLYGNAAGPAWTRLAGSTVASKRWLRQTGTGVISGAPAWDQPASTDLSDSSALIRFNAQNQFDSSNQFACLAWQTTPQSLTTATWTALALDGSDILDQGALHDPSSSNTRITVPTGGDGGWMVVGQVGFAANATGVRGARIRINGAVVVANALEPGPNGVDVQFLTVAVGPIPAVATDYFELMGYQTSGAGLNTDASGVGSTFLGASKLF